MKEILLAAIGPLILAAVPGAWAEDKADGEVRKSVQCHTRPSTVRIFVGIGTLTVYTQSRR